MESEKGHPRQGCFCPSPTLAQPQLFGQAWSAAHPLPCPSGRALAPHTTAGFQSCWARDWLRKKIKRANLGRLKLLQRPPCHPPHTHTHTHWNAANNAKSTDTQACDPQKKIIVWGDGEKSGSLEVGGEDTPRQEGKEK